MSTDLTFITNEAGNHLRDRFNALLTTDTRYFDCLVGYFYLSGFHKIYPALESVDKVRILVGLQTDRTAYELWQSTRRDGELNLSHASTKQKVSHDVLDELEKAPDTQAIETSALERQIDIEEGKGTGSIYIQPLDRRPVCPPTFSVYNPDRRNNSA